VTVLFLMVGEAEFMTMPPLYWMSEFSMIVELSTVPSLKVMVDQLPLEPFRVKVMRLSVAPCATKAPLLVP
jgi:hypothetical protein